MIKQAIEHLQAQLMLTHLFTKVWGLCELINKDGKTYPAYYNGAGGYQDVSQFDRYDGSAYFRLSGSVTRRDVEAEFITTSCGALIEFSIPIRLICVVKKDKMSCDDAYACHELSEMITKMMDNISGLGTDINASSARSEIRSYNISGNEILQQEYKNPSINEFNTNYCYLSMDIEMVIVKDKTCIDAICY